MKIMKFVCISLSILLILCACSNSETDTINEDNTETIVSDCQEYNNQEFGSINIDLTNSTIKIYTGDELSLTYENGEEIEYTITDSILYISAQYFNDMILTLPSDYSYDNVDISVDQGHVYVDQAISTNQLYLDLNNGEASLEGISVSESSAMNVTQGSAYLIGDFITSVDVSCNEGHIEIVSTNNETDYNYDISVSNGNIQIDTNGYHGTTNNTIDNDAQYHMSLTCQKGDIAVEFEN